MQTLIPSAAPLCAAEGGTDPSEGQGGLGAPGQAAPRGCPVPCHRARVMSAGTSGRAPGESHGPLHPPYICACQKWGGGGPAPHSCEAVTMGTQLKATHLCKLPQSTEYKSRCLELQYQFQAGSTGAEDELYTYRISKGIVRTG